MAAAILGLVLFQQSLGLSQVMGIVIVLAALTWLHLTERASEKKLLEQAGNPADQTVAEKA